MKKKSAAATAPKEQATSAPSGMPLFFKSPAALDKMRHARSAVNPTSDVGFARATNSITLNAFEFIEAAKFYPIVFSSGDKVAPIAVVGLESENYFIGADGKWREGTYIPAYVRQYPFIFFEDAAEEKFFLCIDEQSPQFHANGAEGARELFNADGTPSALTDQALEFCTAYYQHYTMTMNFTADLVKHNLLMPHHSQATLASGRKLSLAGFLMIDEKAVNALPEDVFLEFRAKGWLPFIYLALASNSNWSRLLPLAEAK